MGLSFEQAENLAKQRSTGTGEFRKVSLQQGAGNARTMNLPFMKDCYQFGSAETKAVIDNLNNLISIEDAKRLSKVFSSLHFDELNALVKKEIPRLRSAYQGRLTHAALHMFIDFRAGKKLVFEEMVEK